MAKNIIHTIIKGRPSVQASRQCQWIIYCQLSQPADLFYKQTQNASDFRNDES